MTVSGKLYVSRNKSDRKLRTTTAWDDAKRPIISIITDTATNKTFAFTQDVTTDRNSPKDVYFELAEKVTPISYDRKRLKDVKAPERLQTVIQYARLLMEEKQIRK